MNVLLSLSEVFKTPAKDSVLFWAVIGVILGIIILIALRDLFLWYFRINDLYDRVNELSDKVDQLSKNGVAVAAAAPCAAGAPAAAGCGEAEIALAIAIARHAAGVK